MPLWLEIADHGNSDYALVEIVTLLLLSIDMDAVKFGGFYFWLNETPIPHTWSKIRIDGQWYIFDPVKESVMMAQKNDSTITYSWFMQEITNPLTRHRYFLSDRCLNLITSL